MGYFPSCQWAISHLMRMPKRLAQITASTGQKVVAEGYSRVTANKTRPMIVTMSSLSVPSSMEIGA